MPRRHSPNTPPRPIGTTLINVNVPAELKRRVKALLALRGKTMTQLIIDALQRELDESFPIDLPRNETPDSNN